MFTSLSDTLVETGGVTLTQTRFFSGEVYKSTLLGGEIYQDFGAFGEPLSGPDFFVPSDRVTYVPQMTGDPAATLEATWNGSLSNWTSFDATVLLEAFLPPSAAPSAPALTPSGRLALGIAPLGAAGVLTSHQQRSAS